MVGNEDTKWGTADWIRKLKQQAEDSREYRHKLYEKIDLKNKINILDVGCGTGAITLDIAEYTNGRVTGIDIDKEKLKEAKKALKDLPNVTVQEADATDMSFDDETFDLVVFNIVLMHIKDQQKAVNEMVRVTKIGGIVLATAEPDYMGVVQYPEDPTMPMVMDYLKELGADLEAGRKLKGLFSMAGLETEVGMDIESDFLYVNDDKKHLQRFQKSFWVKEKVLKKAGWSTEKIEEFRIEQEALIKNGNLFYLPTAFYGIGKKV
jgi:ubiquinone/menaquinone biosynthesis C-methylase UbiE